MTERNKPSLTELYRRFGSSNARASVPSAADLLELARLDHAEDAASPLYADLVRFTRELEPASAQLNRDVTAAFEQANPATHRRSVAAPRRAAAATRRLRGVAAVAASVLAIIGVWNLQHARVATPQAPVASAPASAADRIFASSYDHAVASSAVAGSAAHDEIFRDQFSLPSDEIFRSHDG